MCHLQTESVRCLFPFLISISIENDLFHCNVEKDALSHVPMTHFWSYAYIDHTVLLQACVLAELFTGRSVMLQKLHIIDFFLKRYPFIYYTF